jgi:MFS transporter, AAHS family, 4-hydroxybenzoate transporter
MLNNNIAVLETRAMSRFQITMVALCFLLNFSDGIDVLIVSFSSTDIIKEFALTKTQMGYIFSAGLAGMTLGCLQLAPMADNMGRRKVFIISTALITLGMYGVWLSPVYTLILLSRFITGLGIGGILPTMTATAAEFSNQKYRDFNIGLVQAGWPIGAILTGLFCTQFIPAFGWQKAFFVAGSFSLAMFIIVCFFMSDSLEFLINNPLKGSLDKVNRLLTKLKLRTLMELPPANKTQEHAGFGSLLGPSYFSNSIKIWVAAFFGFLTLYTLMSWVPTIAKGAGISFKQATWVGIALNIGAALGSASIGFLGNKFGLKPVQLIYMIVAFFTMIFYAFTTLAIKPIFALVLCIGFFVQGGFNGIWPILSRIYPAKIRTTGVGYTVGIGRFGAILGPLIFGFLLDGGLSIKSLFILFSLPLLVMGLCVWSLKSDKL